MTNKQRLDYLIVKLKLLVKRWEQIEDTDDLFNDGYAGAKREDAAIIQGLLEDLEEQEKAPY